MSNSVNSVNIVNSVNSVNSINSYSAVQPPSPMVFFKPNASTCLSRGEKSKKSFLGLPNVQPAPIVCILGPRKSELELFWPFQGKYTLFSLETTVFLKLNLRPGANISGP